MKLFLFAIFLFSMATCQSRSEMEAEYRKLVKEEMVLNETIKVHEMSMRQIEALPNPSEHAALYAINQSSIDSFGAVKNQVSKRKEELSKKLYQK